jgi:hypothetical protein
MYLICRNSVLSVKNGKTKKSSLGRTNLKVKDIPSVRSVEEKQIMKDMLMILIEELL